MAAALDHYCMQLQRKALLALWDRAIWVAEARELQRCVCRHMDGWRLVLALVAWRTAAHRQASVRQAAAQLFCRTKAGHLRAAFEAWRQEVGWAGYLRQLGARLWLARYQAPAFAGWREEAAAGRRLRALLAVAVGHCVIRTSAQVLVAWRVEAARAAHHRRVLLAALARLRHAALDSAVEGWRTAAKERAARRRLLLAAALKLQHSLLARAWLSWTEVAAEWQRRRQLLRRALDRFSGSALQRAWDTWREASREQQAECAAERQQRHIVLLKVGQHGRELNKWLGWEALLPSQHTLPPLSQAFVGWHEATTRSKLLRTRARVMVVQLANRAVAAAWKGWREAVAERSDLRRKAVLLVSSLANGCVRAAFGAWRSRVEQRRRMAAAVARALLHRSGQVLAMAFGGWGEVASEKGHRRWRLLQATSCLTQRQLRTAFLGWRERAMFKAHGRALVAAALGRMGARTAASLFAAWRATATYRTRLHRLEADACWQHLQRTLATSFAFWRLAAARQAVARCAVLSMRQRLLRAALNTWQEAVEQLRMETAAGQHAFAVLRRAWACWRGFASLSAHKRQRLQKAAVVCFASTRLRAWRAWRLHIEQRCKKQRAAETFRLRHLRRCLQGWCATVALTLGLRTRQQQLEAAVHERVLHTSVAKWRAWTQHK